MTVPRYRIGVDVGGTHTDLVLYDVTTGALLVEKVASTPKNPALGVAGAMHDTQLAMLAGAGSALPAELAHPFFWAPFAVIGEGGERVVSAKVVSSTRASGL